MNSRREGCRTDDKKQNLPTENCRFCNKETAHLTNPFYFLKILKLGHRKTGVKVSDRVRTGQSDDRG